MSDRPNGDIVVANPLLRRHWESDSFRQRVTQKELRQLLLADRTIVRAGHVRYLRHEYIGAGVYDIWFEREESCSNQP